MDTYTVKEVAKMMNTSEETVRRWIRSGKLKANMDSRKKGSVITDAMLREFTRNTPKYAAALANPIGGIVAASTLLLGTFVATAIMVFIKKKFYFAKIFPFGDVGNTKNFAINID